jgi:hypothetical protein
VQISGENRTSMQTHNKDTDNSKDTDWKANRRILDTDRYLTKIKKDALSENQRHQKNKKGKAKNQQKKYEEMIYINFKEFQNILY